MTTGRINQVTIVTFRVSPSPPLLPMKGKKEKRKSPKGYHRPKENTSEKKKKQKKKRKEKNPELETESKYLIASLVHFLLPSPNHRLLSPSASPSNIIVWFLIILNWRTYQSRYERANGTYLKSLVALSRKLRGQNQVGYAETYWSSIILSRRFLVHAVQKCIIELWRPARASIPLPPNLAIRG